MEIKDNSRRKFINTCLNTGGLILGGALLLNCRGKNESSNTESEEKEPSTSLDSCNDLIGVSDGEIKKRQSLGYVTKSEVPDNFCGNCGLFIPPKPNEGCGGCILFMGPVEAEGHCVQWAAITL